MPKGLGAQKKRHYSTWIMSRFPTSVTFSISALPLTSFPTVETLWGYFTVSPTDPSLTFPLLYLREATLAVWLLWWNPAWLFLAVPDLEVKPTGCTCTYSQTLQSHKPYLRAQSQSLSLLSTAFTLSLTPQQSKVGESQNSEANRLNSKPHSALLQLRDPGKPAHLGFIFIYKMVPGIDSRACSED